MIQPVKIQRVIESESIRGLRFFKRSEEINKGCARTWGEDRVARPEGFEPPTTWFVARYSIQLSYGRAERGIIVGPVQTVKKENRAQAARLSWGA